MLVYRQRKAKEEDDRQAKRLLMSQIADESRSVLPSVVYARVVQASERKTSNGNISKGRD